MSRMADSLTQHKFTNHHRAMLNRRIDSNTYRLQNTPKGGYNSETSPDCRRGGEGASCRSKTELNSLTSQRYDL